MYVNILSSCHSFISVHIYHKNLPFLTCIQLYRDLHDFLLHPPFTKPSRWKQGKLQHYQGLSCFSNDPTTLFLQSINWHTQSSSMVLVSLWFLPNRNMSRKMHLPVYCHRNVSTGHQWKWGDVTDNLPSNWASGLGLFFLFFPEQQKNFASHRVHCSELKMPPSFFSLLRDRCTFQQAAAISSMTKPMTSSTRDTTRVWGSVLKVNVTPVPAMPITSEMMPKGKTQRYQDFSVPPVAWASRSRVDRSSGALAAAIGLVPSWDRLQSGSSVASCAEDGGWQGKRPEEQPISLTFWLSPLMSFLVAVPPPAACFRSEHLPGKEGYFWQWSIYRAGREQESHAIVTCQDDSFTHFLSQAAMCSLLRCICWVSPACSSSTLSVLLAELTGVYRAEGQGGANESRGSGRSCPIGCLSHDGRWFERAPNRSVIDDADLSTAYATYIHARVLPSHAFSCFFCKYI